MTDPRDTDNLTWPEWLGLIVSGTCAAALVAMMVCGVRLHP